MYIMYYMYNIIIYVNLPRKWSLEVLTMTSLAAFSMGTHSSKQCHIMISTKKCYLFYFIFSSPITLCQAENYRSGVCR